MVTREQVEGMIRCSKNYEAVGIGGQTEATTAVALSLLLIHEQLEKLIEKGIKVKGQLTTWNGTDI